MLRITKNEIARKEMVRRLERYDALVRERRQLIADKAEAVRLLGALLGCCSEINAEAEFIDEIEAFLAKQETE